MEKWIKAKGGVLLNSDLIVSVRRDLRPNGHYENYAHMIDGRVHLLEEDMFKGSKEPYTPTIEDTGGCKPTHIYPQKPIWTSVKDDLPEEGKQVEVCTYEGQVFVSQVLCGKFPIQIGWWKEMPELPEEVRKRKAEMLESK